MKEPWFTVGETWSSLGGFLERVYRIVSARVHPVEVTEASTHIEWIAIRDFFCIKTTLSSSTSELELYRVDVIQELLSCTFDN